MHEYTKANTLLKPSYVSLHTALRFYGLTPEAVYCIQSITTEESCKYVDESFVYYYDQVTPKYYEIGITELKNDSETAQIATPEKALCDVILFKPDLELNDMKEVCEYLEEDLRFDMDELDNFNLDILRECAGASKKGKLLEKIIEFIEYTRRF